MSVAQKQLGEALELEGLLHVHEESESLARVRFERARRLRAHPMPALGEGWRKPRAELELEDGSRVRLDLRALAPSRFGPPERSRGPWREQREKLTVMPRPKDPVEDQEEVELLVSDAPHRRRVRVRGVVLEVRAVEEAGAAAFRGSLGGAPAALRVTHLAVGEDLAEALRRLDAEPQEPTVHSELEGALRTPIALLLAGAALLALGFAQPYPAVSVYLLLLGVSAWGAAALSLAGAGGPVHALSLAREAAPEAPKSPPKKGKKSEAPAPSPLPVELGLPSQKPAFLLLVGSAGLPLTGLLVEGLSLGQGPHPLAMGALAGVAALGLFALALRALRRTLGVLAQLGSVRGVVRDSTPVASPYGPAGAVLVSEERRRFAGKGVQVHTELQSDDGFELETEQGLVHVEPARVRWSSTVRGSTALGSGSSAREWQYAAFALLGAPAWAAGELREARGRATLQGAKGREALVLVFAPGEDPARALAGVRRRALAGGLLAVLSGVVLLLGFVRLWALVDR